MKYLSFIIALLVFTACGNEGTTEHADHADPTVNTDSLEKQQEQEEEEVAEELIHGSFDALNR